MRNKPIVVPNEMNSKRNKLYSNYKFKTPKSQTKPIKNKNKSKANTTLISPSKFIFFAKNQI